jgi:tRNA(Arg) A34 adenosine deaminase TadA
MVLLASPGPKAKEKHNVNGFVSVQRENSRPKGNIRVFMAKKSVFSDLFGTNRKWLDRARKISLLPINKGGSPHPTVKVGAVLVGRNGKEIAASSNRFAHGVDHKNPDRYREGYKSLWISCAEQMVLAEALRKKADIHGAKLYVTLEPCAICAGLIAELQLKQVFVPKGTMERYTKLKPKWKKSIKVGLQKLVEADVKLTVI